jgi:putative flippase GtrA
MRNQRPAVKREFKRFIKFTVVGTIGAIVDFSTFNLLNTVLGVWSVLASGISFAVAVTSNFIWNRFWTYPDSRSKSIRIQIGQFALINLIGLAIRTPIYVLTESLMIKSAEKMMALLPSTLPPGADSFFPIEAQVVGRNLSLAIAVIVVLFWNFGVNRYWTYSDVS